MAVAILIKFRQFADVTALNEIRGWYLQKNKGNRARGPNDYSARTCTSLYSQRPPIRVVSNRLRSQGNVDRHSRVQQSMCNVFALIPLLFLGRNSKGDCTSLVIFIQVSYPQ